MFIWLSKVFNRDSLPIYMYILTYILGGWRVHTPFKVPVCEKRGNPLRWVCDIMAASSLQPRLSHAMRGKVSWFLAAMWFSQTWESVWQHGGIEIRYSNQTWTGECSQILYMSTNCHKALDTTFKPPTTAIWGGTLSHTEDRKEQKKCKYVILSNIISCSYLYPFIPTS